MFDMTLTAHIAEHLAGAVAQQAELLQAERITTAEAAKWLSSLAEILTLLAGKPEPPGGTVLLKSAEAAVETPDVVTKPVGTIFTGPAALWREIQLRVWRAERRGAKGQGEGIEAGSLAGPSPGTGGAK